MASASSILQLTHSPHFYPRQCRRPAHSRPACLVDCFSPDAQSLQVLRSVIAQQVPIFAHPETCHTPALALALFVDSHGEIPKQEPAGQASSGGLLQPPDEQQVQCIVVHRERTRELCERLFPSAPKHLNRSSGHDSPLIFVDARPTSAIGTQLPGAPTSLQRLATALKDALVLGHGSGGATRAIPHGGGTQIGDLPIVKVPTPLTQGVALAGALLGYPSVYCLEGDDDSECEDAAVAGGKASYCGSANNLADAPLFLFRMTLQPLRPHIQNKAMTMLSFSTPEETLANSACHSTQTAVGDARELADRLEKNLEESILKLGSRIWENSMGAETFVAWLKSLKPKVEVERVELPRVSL